MRGGCVCVCEGSGSGAEGPPGVVDVDAVDPGEHWVTIQRNTFANWVVEQLGRRAGELGLGAASTVDLRRDLVDGRLLCALVEVLQQQRQRLTVSSVVRTPVNQHQCIDNINRALRAITDDGIRLVNIGNRHRRTTGLCVRLEYEHEMCTPPQ